MMREAIADRVTAMAKVDTWLAVWVGFCSLAGIALSVIVPLWIWRKVT
jgi:hypothetical protein